MSEAGPSVDRDGLLAWLRSERRLGIAHIDASHALAVSGAAPAPPSERPAAPPLPPRRSDARAQELPVSAPRDEADLPPVCTSELPETQARLALEVLDEKFVRSCTRCALHAGRSQTVFGVGPVRPDIVFVGEGPGADEDEQGLPFVGRAGELLTRMIAAMTLTRAQVYICNVVKCRPPGNRTPTEAEMATCSPYLFRQLAVLRPRVIVALGRPASQTLLATAVPISRLRGEFHDFPPPALQHHGLPACKLMPTFHPAYLLRSPEEKPKGWHDLKQVMRFLGIAVPAQYDR